MVLPLVEMLRMAFLDRSGEFVWFENYRRYFGNPALSRSIMNTVDISLWTTLISSTLGFLYAYALTRTRVRCKTFFKYTALIPIFIPTVVHALGLIYLFGRQGMITRALDLDFEIYGRIGIIMAEVVFTFPQAFLMFLVALKFADGRLYEAADSMGVSNIKKMFTITLPEIKYTVVNVFFVCFTLAFTDFGAPKVLGGNFNVLATDIYQQVVGQFNMNMGAVVGTLLLVPAIVSFIADRVISSKNAGTLSAKASELEIKKNTARDVFFTSFCAIVSLSMLALVGSLFVGAFTEFYPFNMAPTLKHFNFPQAQGGITTFFNSIQMAGLTAVFGTMFVFIYAYLLEKSNGFGTIRRFGKLLGILPLAVPGMVIGLSFIFFFNSRTNPLNFLIGTVAILVLANIISFFSVPFLTASACLKKLDKEYESVADSMSVPRWKTFLRVSVPLSMPAILESFMYFFVNAMVTVSAMVFLVSPRFNIAAIALTHMEENGRPAQAAAMAILILGINVLVRVLYEVSVKIIKYKLEKREVANEN
jgi:iron(III) transport system permease protein